MLVMYLHQTTECADCEEGCPWHYNNLFCALFTSLASRVKLLFFIAHLKAKEVYTKMLYSKTKFI